MACNIAANRLRKELSKLRKDPPPGIIAEPKESDILTWFYALRGPPDTPYEGGIYVGKLKFPSEYPMKPPSILMLTPSGRFVVNTRICMSMSDFHPEAWNPLWSVASILQGVVSFMASEELTTGGLKASDTDRKRFASASRAYNDQHYSHLFDGDIVGMLEEADQSREVAEQATAEAATSSSSTSRTGRGRRIAGPRRKTRQPTSKTNETEAVAEADEEEEEEDTGKDATGQEAEAELSAAELARKKKNAKKRAKQKAKKAAAKVDDNNNNNDAGNDAE